MRLILGVDEVGRGCWAGPLVAAAVVLNQSITGLKDSKLLTKSRREKLNAQIQLEALAIGLGWVSAAEIDNIGLTRAVGQAMQQAIDQIDIDYETIIIDGDYNFFPENPKVTTLIKADNLVPAVSAASIVAKVARDRFMSDQARLYPFFGFEKHVGYGTQAHIESIRLHGICELHRKSYKPIQKLIGARP